MNRLLLCFLLLITCSFVSLGQTVISVADNPYKNLGRKIGFKEDRSKTAGFGQIEALPDTAFKAGNTDIFNGGTSGKVWWMKLNYTTDRHAKVYLVLDYGNIDYIDIYYRDSLDKVQHIRSGTFASSASRTFMATEYIFQLPDNIRGNPKEVYVRLRAVNTLLLPVKLVDGLVLAKALHSKYVWQIIYIGVAFSLFLFNLLMLILTRDRLYGLYIIRIFALFYVYVLAYLNGYAHFFGDQVSRFTLIHAHVFAAIGFIATIYFNIQFLNLKKYIPNSIKFFNVLTVLWLCIMIISFWDTRELTNRITQIMVFVSSIAVLYTSIRFMKILSKLRNPLILCYVLGWLPISLTTVYVVLTLIKVLPFEDYTLKVLTGAGILEATLISLAMLGDRFRILRKDKEKAEQASIRLVKERNTFLEHKIEERTEELLLVNDKLKESNGQKDKLFSIIAHDMRTPLANLKAVLQLADRDMIDSEELGNFLVRIKRNTEQVQKTMDNLLSWSISQMGMQRYQPEVLDVHDFLHDQLANYETLAGNKQISTTINCEEQMRVFADRNQLSLIVRNLLDNAIKFTPQSGLISIDLKLLADRAHIAVGNSGEALSTETIARILGNDKEVLGTSYGTAQEKGTGLGLQLCKEFIKNMQSELNIECRENTDGINVVFSFEIPLHVESSKN